MNLTSRPWRREGCLLLHPERNLAIADFFPDELPGGMVHHDTHSAQEHAAFALKAVNAYDRLQNDNARQERAIVELKDWKEKLLRQRAALLGAAKASRKEFAQEEAIAPAVLLRQLDAVIALAEGDDEKPEYQEEKGSTP